MASADQILEKFYIKQIAKPVMILHISLWLQYIYKIYI